MSDDTMTVTELASRLGVARGTAYAAVRAGQVPGIIRIGKLVRLSRTAIEKWLGRYPACAQCVRSDTPLCSDGDCVRNQKEASHG